MPSEPQLFRVDPKSRAADRIEEVDFGQLGLQERRDIQEWVAANPGILGDDLLIIGKEFSGFDRSNERLDLVAIDSGGVLVVIELKRDDTGADAHWQAIKYASYFQHATADAIIEMAASYKGIPEKDAENQLLQHLGADDLIALNNDQRIILASHRFAPEVTSATLWLNEKAPGENLITCVKLTPYQDESTKSLYLQATTIIPVPGVDDYIVGIGERQHGASTTGGRNRNWNDEVTHFLRKVADLAVENLPPETQPDRRSRWAGDWEGRRYYHLWYRRPIWGNWSTSYRVNLWPQDERGSWRANVKFKHEVSGLNEDLPSVSLHPDQQLDDSGIEVQMDADTLNEGFAGRIAEVLRRFIEAITPIVDRAENASNEMEG